MTTIQPSKLIEALSKARETVNEIKNELEKIQPYPEIGDVWKRRGDSHCIVTNVDDLRHNTKDIRIVRLLPIQHGGWFDLTIKELHETCVKVGTVENLQFHELTDGQGISSSRDTGPIEQDKDLPKFRPFTKADWDMFAGATCFTARKGSTTELITPHIKELDWALVVVDKSGIEIYPSCDLTHGDPEYWMVNWKEVDLPRMREIDQMDARDAIEVCESLMCEINSYMDLKQQDGFRKVS